MTLAFVDQDAPEGKAPPPCAYISDIWYVAGCLSEFPKNREMHTRICGMDLSVRQTGTGHCHITETLSGRALPSHISEDLVWVFVPSSNAIPDTLPPVPRFEGPRGKVRFFENVVIPAPQDDAVYGLLDPAHTPFVHKSPFWRGNGILKEKTKPFSPSHMGFTMEPHAPVNSDIYHVIGGQISVRIYFRLPGLRAEYISNRKHQVLGLTALTPIDEKHTRLRQIFYWNSPVLNLIRPFASLFARPFLQQDVDIMRLRSENLPYGGKGMLLGDSDRQFIWYNQLKHEWDRSGHDETRFENPLEPMVLRWRT